MFVPAGRLLMKGVTRIIKIYLDNCCYNRPYDDQTQIRIYLETEAKLYIQGLVKNSDLALVTSYMLEYENGLNRFKHKKQAISEFMDMNGSYYVGVESAAEAKRLARHIMDTGIKSADALHVACALLAESDYLITTDDRLLKYQSEDIQIVTPGEFVRRLEETD